MSLLHHVLGRYFRTDSVVVQKRIQPWSLYTRWTGTEVSELAALYQATASAQGLVHAVAGPRVDGDKYTVSLQPVGLPHTAATPRGEDGLRRVAHALLHALAAIHLVSASDAWIWASHCCVTGCCDLECPCLAVAGRLCVP